LKKSMADIQTCALILGVILLACSCKQEEGKGGTSIIKGKVYVMNYNSSGELVGQYYGAEEHVYIIYGDAAYYGDDLKTNYDGTYEFDYLHKGSYSIYAYSKCDTCESGQEPVIINTEIDKNHSTSILPDLVIRH
jgi:hypothetical protein